MKKSILYFTVSILLLPTLLSAQTGNRRVHNSKNPYRDSYQRVSAGSKHTLEIRNGALWAYGYNGYGQLGDGTIVDENTPVQIDSAANWTMLSAGGNHSLGIQADGTLWAWGLNSNGQLGDGSNTDTHLPEQISTDTGWISISAGNNHSLAIKANGTLWAWGADSSGQLGDGTNVNKNTPTQIGSDNNWVTISAGGDRSFAIRSDGTLWAWGDNTNSRLGDGTNTNHNSPVQIGTASNWVSISAGPDHTLALQSNGTLWAWGGNSHGQLGDNTITDETTPVKIGTSNNWVTVSAGELHSLGIKADGTLWTWGDNTSGELGDSTNTAKNIPTQIAVSNKWVAVCAGYGHSFALSANGLLNSWGDNTNGQLGDSTNANKKAPAMISSVVNWVKIAPGGNFTLALRSDGTLWAWGDNLDGDLGDSSQAIQHSPVKVGNAIWVNVEAGISHAVGIQQDGTLWAWGNNYYGQVGDGTSGGPATRFRPVQISTTNDWAGLTAGDDHTMALKANGTIWTWGSNSNGELGRTGGNNFVPQQMGTDTDWIFIESGGGGNGLDHSLAIKSNGTLWVWGSNSVGQLGLGGNPTGTGPNQLGTETDWVSVSGGQGFTEAIKADGSLWGWGLNAYYCVGNNSTNNVPSPVQIAPGTNNWINVTTGTLHAAGLRSDGSLWGWGYNFSGQLGTGGGGGNVPTATIPPKGWGTIGAGSEANSSLAIKPDRLSYCTTGANNEGQLGDGTTTQRNKYNCISLVVITPPIAKFVATPLTICAGSKVTFTDQSTGSPLTWRWTFTSGTPPSSVTKNQVVTYNTPGLFNVKLIVTGTGGTDSIIKTGYINVLQSPSLSISPSDTSLCAGSAVTLAATGAAVYTWSPAIGLSSTTDSTVFTSPDSSASYMVVGSIGSCYDTAFTSIILIPFPVAGIISSTPDTICAGQSSTITVTGSTGSIQWQSSQDGNIFTNLNSDSVTTYTNNNVPQTTYYRIKAFNGCGVDTTPALKLLVHPLPIPVVQANDSIICSNDSTLLQTTLNYSSYHWSTGDVTAYTQATVAGGYWVSVTDANGCSAVSNHKNISVYPVPFVSIVVLGDSLSSYNSNYFQWYFQDSIIPGANSPVYIAHRSGNYAVQIIDTNGCKAISNDVSVVINSVGDMFADNGLSIYPNPADEYITVRLKSLTAKGELKIYNTLDQLVWIGALQQEQIISIKNLSSAQYYIVMQSDNAYKIEKIIIEHNNR